MTFDGTTFSFMGACTYVLSEALDGSFKVLVSNVPCGTRGMTCTKSIRIIVGGYNIYMMQGSGWSFQNTICFQTYYTINYKIITEKYFHNTLSLALFRHLTFVIQEFL